MANDNDKNKGIKNPELLSGKTDTQKDRLERNKDKADSRDWQALVQKQKERAAKGDVDPTYKAVVERKKEMEKIRSEGIKDLSERMYKEEKAKDHDK